MLMAQPSKRCVRFLSSSWTARCGEIGSMLRLFNSLTRRKERFVTRANGVVKLFVCGPTVYDYAHLGHARTYIAFDIIARYLRFLGYNVRFLMNITDVAERIFQRAGELHRDSFQLAREYESYFLDDMKALGIGTVDGYFRASEYIPEMIAQVTGLINRGVGYETNTGVYFEVRKFPKFGQLSGQSQQEFGLRRLELCSSKRNPEDFSLWRKYENEPGWDSPWGHGRPGWHIEDTAISMSNFGETYDVHGGASELIFPHHEAEIAQAEALSGKSPFVRFWLHSGLLSVKGRKMSKSLGNVIRIRDALKKYTAQELRYYFASFHYRQQIVAFETAIRRAKFELNALTRNLESFLATEVAPSSRSGKRFQATLTHAEAVFKRYMDDDFNTPGALNELAVLSKRLAAFANKRRKIDEDSKNSGEATFRRMADVLGIL